MIISDHDSSILCCPNFSAFCFCLFTAGASFTNFIRIPWLPSSPISAEEEPADRYIYFQLDFILLTDWTKTKHYQKSSFLKAVVWMEYDHHLATI